MRKRLVPVDVYDIPKMQSYLSDMAAEGLFLRKIGSYAYFEEAQPRRLTYRLEPLMREEMKPREDQIDHYKDYGWEYVCTIQNGFHIYSTEKSDFTELHTDPVIQSYAFTKMESKLKLASGVYLVSLPIIMLMILFPIIFQDHPLLAAVRYGNSTAQMLMLIFTAFVFYQLHESRKRLKLLLDGFDNGEGIPKKSTYWKSYAPYIINGILTIFAVLTIITSILMMTKGWERNVADYEDPLPMIQLKDIQKEEEFSMEQDGYRNDEISYDWTEMAPTIYELHQRGEVKGRMWDDGSGTYSPALSSEYYEVRFAFMGKHLVRELMEEALGYHRYRSITYQELIYNGFDDAILVEIDESQIFLGRIGKSVLSMHYYGYEDLSDHLEEIYQNLINYQNEKM